MNATITRREVLRAGSLTALGLTLPDLFHARARAVEPGVKPRPAAKSCILIWLDGGPSHIDLFDPKPDAPAEIRGPFKPAATSVPGIQIGEYLPEIGKWMNEIALVRSMTHPLGEHNFGSHYMLTGYKPTPVLSYPSYGSVLAHLRGTAGVLPPYIAIPDPNSEARAGFLPATCRPFEVGGDPSRPDFRVRDLSPYAGVDAERLTRRRDFLAAFDSSKRQLEGAAKSEAMPADPQFEQAYRLIASPEAQRAFDLTAERGETRARYGQRTLGQSCLVARRLVEAGVPFVTVTDRGWDTHESIYNRLKEGYTGGTAGKAVFLDQAVSALLTDLSQRNMLSETLVLVMGEFGRTPRLNTSAGRDHWPRVFSMLMAGGGIRGGQVIGTSDARGESPAENPVTPADLARTIYTRLGVQPDRDLHTPDGRPVAINQGGKLLDV